MANYYIATTISNWRNHNVVRDLLDAHGHRCTYDWTVNLDHGDLRGKPVEQLQKVAQEEMQGIRDADLVIVLLPGGVGTHAEIGAAYILGKPTIINAAPKYFSADPVTGMTRNFYWSPNTKHSTVGDLTEFAQEIVAWVADLSSTTYLDVPIPLELRNLADIEACSDCPVGGRYNFEDGGEQETTCARAQLCDWECHRQVEYMAEADAAPSGG
jgi:hypothetical protein